MCFKFENVIPPRNLDIKTKNYIFDVVLMMITTSRKKKPTARL
jgi:hypothetical protein